MHAPNPWPIRIFLTFFLYAIHPTDLLLPLLRSQCAIAYTGVVAFSISYVALIFRGSTSDTATSMSAQPSKDRTEDMIFQFGVDHG
jgi:hypothetical protein